MLSGLESLRSHGPDMRKYSGPSLDQKMVCHLFGTKASFEPMLHYCNSTEQNRKTFQQNLNQDTILFGGVVTSLLMKP